MPTTPSINTLFYGDNLDILREYIADESVDLVYFDPPFNSNATYNVLILLRQKIRGACMRALAPCGRGQLGGSTTKMGEGSGPQPLTQPCLLNGRRGPLPQGAMGCTEVIP